MSIKAWSDEQEAELVKLYTEENTKDVYELAEIFDKGYRSVISKLVQLKIYEKLSRPARLELEFQYVLGLKMHVNLSPTGMELKF